MPRLFSPLVPQAGFSVGLLCALVFTLPPLGIQVGADLGFLSTDSD